MESFSVNIISDEVYNVYIQLIKPIILSVNKIVFFRRHCTESFSLN